MQKSVMFALSLHVGNDPLSNVLIAALALVHTHPNSTLISTSGEENLRKKFISEFIVDNSSHHALNSNAINVALQVVGSWRLT